jgi:hypothetical protein
MKFPAVLFSVSLAANAAFLLTLALHPSLAPSGIRDYFSTARASDSISDAPPGRTAAEEAAAGKNARKDAAGPHPPLWSTFDKGDLKRLVAQLQAAGFPVYAIREIVSDSLRDKYEGAIRRLMQPDPNTPYWKTPPPGVIDPARVAEVRHLTNEYNQILRDLLGNFATRNDGDITGEERRRFGNLSAAKIDAATRITGDYDEMTAQLRAAMNNIILPEDREKLALLEREKHADLAAVLTPEELADYDMRNSTVTARLRPAMTLFNPTESEFRAIYQIQSPLADTLYPTAIGGTSINLDTVDAAQRSLQGQLQAALGEQRFVEYTRSMDRDYQTLAGLEQQQNLPAGTAVQAYDLRTALAQESTRIAKDPALNGDQKRAALQALGQSTRTQLVAALGPVASETYLRTANTWLNMVEHGNAVTFLSTTLGTVTRLQPISFGPRDAVGRAAPARP